MYTKVESYKKIWVLVFSFMYLVSVDPMDRSVINKFLAAWFDGIEIR